MNTVSLEIGLIERLRFRLISLISLVSISDLLIRWSTKRIENYMYFLAGVKHYLPAILPEIDKKDFYQRIYFIFKIFNRDYERLSRYEKTPAYLKNYYTNLENCVNLCIDIMDVVKVPNQKTIDAINEKTENSNTYTSTEELFKSLKLS